MLPSAPVAPRLTSRANPASTKGCSHATCTTASAEWATSLPTSVNLPGGHDLERGRPELSTFAPTMKSFGTAIRPYGRGAGLVDAPRPNETPQISAVQARAAGRRSRAAHRDHWRVHWGFIEAPVISKDLPDGGGRHGA